jgi:hypothetical protein
MIVMKTHSLAFFALLSLYSFIGTEATQKFLSSPIVTNFEHHRNQAITPALSSFTRRLLSEAGAPGLSLGIVYLDEDNSVQTEYGAWGNMTEDGDAVTPQVCRYICNSNSLRFKLFVRHFLLLGPVPRPSSALP